MIDRSKDMWYINWLIKEKKGFGLIYRKVTIAIKCFRDDSVNSQNIHSHVIK